MQLRDHSDAVGIGGVDDVTLIHRAQTNATCYRRGDVRIGELQGGAGDLRLVHLKRRLILAHECRLRVHLLPGHRVLFEQRLEPLKIHSGIFEQGIVLRELGLGL